MISSAEGFNKMTDGHPDYKALSDREIEHYLSFKSGDIASHMNYRILRALEDMSRTRCGKDEPKPKPSI